MKQKILEINPDHTMVQKMLEMAKDEDEENLKKLEEISRLLVDAAKISSGYELED